MKIGILTHHYINNFGAFLQAYSLQEAIKEIRPDDDISVINYINLKHFIINTGGWFRYYKKRESFVGWISKTKLPITFYNARKKYLNLTKSCYKTKHVNKLNFDYIVIGSDEVWNFDESKGKAKIKFGLGLNCKNLIAYAPSIGNSNIKSIPNYVIEGINKFKFVSARDEQTEKLITQIKNEKIHRVLDPTFLCNIPNEVVKDINKPYILFYYCDRLKNEEKDKIFKFAKENGLDVYGAGEDDKRYTKITVNLTPFQWAWMFNNAKYVVTGTFHGVVFSILNHKNFVCYLTNPSRIKKVNSLLEEFGLENRISNGNGDNILKILLNQINYDFLDIVVKKKIEESKKYLINAFSE